MATGRIGVTPVLRTRWSDQPTAATTSLTGLDDNSVALVYDVGYEAVYRNGVLLSRGNDYTATDGTTITLIDATLAGDIIEVFANDLVPLTDAISKGQYNAKGALLSATAASTPAVLAVGTNDHVLTADSAEATGLKWAAVPTGGMTLLSTTTLSGASTTISAINQSFNNLQIIISGVNISVAGALQIAPNGSTNITDFGLVRCIAGSGASVTGENANYITQISNLAASSALNAFSLNIFNYASTSHRKSFNFSGRFVTSSSAVGFTAGGGINTTSAISSLVFDVPSSTFTAGQVLIYGVK